MKKIFIKFFCSFVIDLNYEMEISKSKAEWTLREHAGNVVEALAVLTN